MGYHSFKTDEGMSYGSFEVFYNDGMNLTYNDGQYHGKGWFWWACWPGCMPDGDPMGPFETEEEAIKNAEEF